MSKEVIYKLSKVNKFIKQKLWNVDDNNWNITKTTSCGDKFTVSITQIVPTVENINFLHEGCLLSRAALNSLLLEIEGLSLEDAKKKIEAFINMCKSPRKKNDDLSKRLVIFKKFLKYPNRKSCILYPALTILNSLNGS